jgi:arylsulfatase A-like enzyme
VPGIIEWPARIKPASETGFPAVTSDYLPTILDVVGVELPDRRPVDGISLVPVFEGKLHERPVPIGFQFGGKLALTDNRYKLVYYPEKQAKRRNRQNRAARRGAEPRGPDASRQYMLFDLVDDPAETTDLAADHPDVVRRMAATLEAWEASCRQSAEGEDYQESSQGPVKQ